LSGESDAAADADDSKLEVVLLDTKDQDA